MSIAYLDPGNIESDLRVRVACTAYLLNVVVLIVVRSPFFTYATLGLLLL